MSMTTLNSTSQKAPFEHKIQPLLRSISATMAKTSTQTDATRTTLKGAPRMQSVRFHGPDDIRVEEVDEPVCGKGHVKVCL